MSKITITRREWRNVILSALVIIVLTPLCFVTYPVHAQDTKPQELLYRSGDTLYLANITAGTTTALPDIKISDSDRWHWSPDGHYLAVDFTQEEVSEKLVRVYDVDKQQWIHDISIGTFTTAFDWSSDSTHIAYAKATGYGYAELWIFDLKTRTQRKLYQTKHVTGNAITGTEIWGIWWSPDGRFLIFDEVYSTMAYPIPHLRLISADGKQFDALNSPFSGNSTDKPVWSPDSKWFLVSQWETAYVAFNPKALRDLILYGIDGQIYQLTYTPDVQEFNERWSADGKQIQFETDTQSVSIELQSVLNDSLDQPTTVEQTISPLPPERQPLSEVGEEIFSPDGQWVVFIIHKINKLSALDIARSDGSQYHNLADDVTFLGWRPS